MLISLRAVVLAAVALLAPLAVAQELSPQLTQQVVDLFAGNGSVSSGATEAGAGTGAGGRHTNNWAVLVCASRYWFNYRHMANTLAMYRTIKRLGIPDSNIILMLADDVACNARNAFPATVYANAGRQMDLYGDGIEVDYRGYEVTVESFLRLLTGRHPDHLPPSKRLLTDASSNVFIYMTGHGGNEFLKFQDNEEVSAFDIADAIEQMWEKRRFNKLLYVVDTCQANTMFSKFYSPNIISTGSSSLGENSYSHHHDLDIGVAVIDSFTHYILEYLETLGKSSKATLKDFFNTYDPACIQSHPGISTELSQTPSEEILVTDFFGGVASVEITPKGAELDMLRAAVPRWEASPRRKTIGRGMEVAWDSAVGQGAVEDRGKDVGGAWKRPLERRGQGVLWMGMGMGIKEVGVVVGLAGVVYLLLRPQTGKET